MEERKVRRKSVPFDSICLAAIALEVSHFVGSKVQKIIQPSDRELGIELYGGQVLGDSMLYFNIDPQHGRVHFSSLRFRVPQEPPVFCATCRARLASSRLTAVEQIENDRILKLTFEREGLKHFLIAEIMGKHSNLILLEDSGRMVAAAKWVPTEQSRRVILPNQKYRYPPVLRKGGELTSPFFESHFETDGKAASELLGLQKGKGYLYRDFGAYPLPLANIGGEFKLEIKPSFSIALELYFQTFLLNSERDHLRTLLQKSLSKTLGSRQHAISELKAALEEGSKENLYQKFGDLLLTFKPIFAEGMTQFITNDFEGIEMKIPVDWEKSAIENAENFYRKAKQSKARRPEWIEQLARLSQDASEIETILSSIDEAEIKELRHIQDYCRSKRWTGKEPVLAGAKHEEKGHKFRIREMIGPGNVTIFYGENAESNDYLTLRIAKSNDYWLHVRGGTSAHVVIQTQNHPEKINVEALLFAAKIAVKHSQSKHSKFVPVDYTLKKYVRKPKGAAIGSAIYTHEKTLHVESE